MNKKIKGQISVEFIVLLAIFMLFFQATILPTIEFSENIIKDTYNLSKTSDSVSRLATHIENFSNSSGFGRRSIFFYLPDTAIISACDYDSGNPVIKYNVTISKQRPIPLTCNDQGVCNFVKKIESDAPISCEVIGPGFSGAIILEKSETGEIIIKK